MGDLIRFPVERRKPRAVRELSIFDKPLVYPGTDTHAGVTATLVQEPGWFGVRLRPVPPPS